MTQVQEDLGLIQHAKSYFLDHCNQQHHPKPALSEQSTSNPASSSDQYRYHSTPIPPMLLAVDPQVKEAEATHEKEADDDEDEEEEEAELDSETETGRDSHTNAAQNPSHLHGPATHGAVMAQPVAEPSELMQLEMSEDIRLGSPENCSNNVESELQPRPVDHQPHTESYQAESAQPWPFLQYEFGAEPSGNNLLGNLHGELLKVGRPTTMISGNGGK